MTLKEIVAESHAFDHLAPSAKEELDKLIERMEAA
jgi:hypothetical protein